MKKKRKKPTKPQIIGLPKYATIEVVIEGITPLLLRRWEPPSRNIGCVIYKK